ncbi:N-acetylglucosamine-1-phosphotransferase subunits alpha/beta-like isoform X2 [Saccostrea echinata]|uniref:N-acetylglucosamine-1-phosphotransferase subunits alpha/beta-like isoform X2 n=1 Tax=Saccostrea echinata TaxID=191078 RepID=UPI002A806559|nr:N-acetylglucosamine-1-phosphotransferase subunits alpha/beta-like isoform X2 [Saccostrea echinata]
MLKNLKKVIQKQVYDILSHKYGIFMVIAAAVILIVATLHFGETVLEWSHEKYAAVFNSYSDNIAGRSFRTRLCTPLPIDIVYTWVNGTDPRLLSELRAFKMGLEKEHNITKEEKCVFANCLATNLLVLDPIIPHGTTLEDLTRIKSEFSQATKTFTVNSPSISNLNFTVVEFTQKEPVLSLMNHSLIIGKQNFTMTRGYYTSDWTVHNSILLSDTIIMAGFPSKYSADELKEKLPEKAREGIDKITIDTDSGLAVLYVPDKKSFDILVTAQNISIDGKKPTLNAANLVWDLRDFSRDEDISSSRFEDNDELRYSLRSVEKFAPWIRHVFIVTNGQIPHWLDLENPRVTIVTHEEIFPNKSHLPTFSSPAIEANIHRIPGLSKKFIYMNDDVMFGKEVWPEDFFTQATGQRVYLTWPVPSCQEGCPSTWINDGYCDKACNNSECDFDGGDCSGEKAQQGGGGVQWPGYGHSAESENKYCNKGCATSWLADRYCDTSCNVHNCGYDVGDCGVNNYKDLYEIKLYGNTTKYAVPPGETIAFLNLTELIGSEGSILSAGHNKSDVVRSASVANKFKVITILLYSDHNRTAVSFKLKGHTGNDTNTFNFTFTLMTDTKQRKSAEILQKIANNTQHNITTTEKPYIYDVPKHKRGPKKTVNVVKFPMMPQLVNLSAEPMPEELQEEWKSIKKELENGEITEKGFQLKQGLLWKKYQSYLEESRQGNIQRRSLLSVIRMRPQPIRDLALTEEDLDDVIRMGSEPESNLPWEKLGVFSKLTQEKENQKTMEAYTAPVFRGRQLLDIFGDSLRHVNRLYNKAFGYTARKVPGHMPHMVDKDIMNELHERFPAEFGVTSSNKIRSRNDMQFAFSYFYYLMGVTRNRTAEEIFEELDTDKSGVLSDREIRTLAARVNDLPLELKMLTNLEELFINCSQSPNITEQEVTRQEVTRQEAEEYYDKRMPQVTRALFTQCEEVKDMVQKKFPPVNKYKYTTDEDSEIAFKMIKTNSSTTVGQLDDIRKNPKKFICLNDNIDHDSEDAKTVKAILQDFYEALFPLRSQFELPREYRNRFNHVDELREWKVYRDWMRLLTHLSIVLLILFMISSYFYDQIESCYRKYCRRRVRTSSGSTSSSSSGTLITV